MFNENSFATFYAHLRQHATKLQRSRQGVLGWDDAELHEVAYQKNPTLYALIALAPNVQNWQRTRILLQILKTSRVELDQASRQLLDRVAYLLLLALPRDQIIMALLCLRHLRANHKHTARVTLRFILDHPHADHFIQARRPALRDCFEHALGKATACACAKMILKPETRNEDYLQRHLLRYTRDPQSAQARVAALYGSGTTPSLTEEMVQPLVTLDNQHERPKTVTATNRGDIAATLVHVYRGGASPELTTALDRYLGEAVQNIPLFTGRVALIVDASASMRSYGDREYAALSQSVAFQRFLTRCCSDLRVMVIGGTGDLPQPQGATDLALALLDALDQTPEVVLIVSDGYENHYPGDLARVVATLPQLGIHTPILFCHSAFTGSDDLTYRRPARSLPERILWHQNDFEPILFDLVSQTPPEFSEVWLRSRLLATLDMAAARQGR